MARRYSIALFLLFALASALYAPHLSHPFLWDDGVQIDKNPAVTDGVPVWRYFTDRETTSTRPDYNDRIYRPLRNLLLRQVWRASDHAPKHRERVFLCVNLALFLVGAWLVFLLCRRFTHDALGPLLATGAWLLLPVHCEDVLYASAFGDLLSCDLQLVALLFAIRAVEPTARTREAVLALVFYALALCAKEMAIAQVLLVPLYILSERRELLRELRSRIRLAWLVALHGLVTVFYLVVRISLLKRVGQEPTTLRSFFTSASEIGWLLMRYLGITLAPIGHSPDYGLHHPDALWRMLGFLAAGALVFLATRRARHGVRFGAWLFVLGLLPVLHLVPVWTLMADRFVLVPSVGIALVVAGLVVELESRRAPLVVGLALLGFLLWGFGIAQESKRFRGDDWLWDYAVQSNPESPLAQHNLGLYLTQHGHPEEGLRHLLVAAQLGRDVPKLYFHIALAFDLLRQPIQALKALDVATQRDPKYVTAYVMRAQLLRRGGDLAGCEHQLDEAAAIDPRDSLMLSERGALAGARGDKAGALELYRRAAQAEPEDPSLWQHVAATALEVGKVDEARAAVTRCLALEPDFKGCRAVQAALPK